MQTSTFQFDFVELLGSSLSIEVPGIVAKCEIDRVEVVGGSIFLRK